MRFWRQLQLYYLIAVAFPKQRSLPPASQNYRDLVI